ncbi:MAG: redoxin domain-containing protein [Burkholderiaceae bacterium]|nr:redoxin domain-containing protein [Burkholderiaceae bacterium]
MNRRAALCLAMLVSSGLAAQAQAAATVGQPAPNFRATDTNGRTHQLADFRGKYLVLEWTNPGCPFVRKHYGSGNMQALQKEFTAKNVVWLAVNSTETASADYLAPAQLAAWMTAQAAAPTATLMDVEGTMGRAFGARTTPHMYIVDPQGRLVYAGGIDSIASSRMDDIKTATNHVRRSLSEALAGKPLSMATTPPYGCSIKYKS